VTPAVSAPVAERSPTEVDHREANDLDRLAASLDALAFLSQPEVEEANLGDGSGEVPAGKIGAMSTRTSAMAGLFEPEATAAFERGLQRHLRSAQPTIVLPPVDHPSGDPR
jgi:hypothetical protein